uniref:YD repeat-containing protein n=1 Tax=Chryseobacterium endophyticum TaxID=1854762 RepID=A0AAU6WVD9_9FLAO
MPLLSIKEIYRKNEQLPHHTEANIYKYLNYNTEFLTGVKVQQTGNFIRINPSYNDPDYMCYDCEFRDDYISSFYFEDTKAYEDVRVLDKTIIKDKFVSGNELITTTTYNYNNAIHLQPTSKSTVFSDGVQSDTQFKYAHEKGNQLMISKNMIGIPLETTTTQTIGGVTKTLGKTETIYPTALPTSQTGTLVLPLSSVSYDLQNNAPTADITYDKYDSKGNLLQYTGKDWVSTTIIWGYNQTQPIAKITGAKLSDISQSLIDSIVSASDTDAAAAPGNDETALLNALDAFRKDPTLANYQVTTYSYDPLIGVRSITPPSGIREVYIYDAANRLKEIREDNQFGKILKEFKYNYKN